MAESAADPSWVSFYPPGVTATLEPEYPNALEAFRSCVRDLPLQPAIRYFSRTFTYQELDEASDAFGIGLRELGVSANARIAIALQNCPEFTIAVLAAWKINATPLPVNPMYRRGELARIFADAQPAAVLSEIADAIEIEPALGQAQLPDCLEVLTNPLDFGLDYAPFHRSAAGRVPRGTPLRDILRTYAGKRLPSISPEASELGVLLYTSGTTGAPKGAQIRHSSLAFNAQFMRDWCGLDPRSRIWALAPYFHITGLVCHMAASFSAKCAQVVHYRFDPKLALAVIREARPTFAIGAITAFNALMNVEEAKSEDLSSFRQIFSGGAPIPPALQAAFAARFGIEIRPAFGMTETTAPTHFTPPFATAPIDPESGVLSIGIPIPSTDAAIVDDEDRELPYGQTGELVVRGPQIMQGYWRKPEESSLTLRNGWMHTGDVGFRNKAGWFFLVDRKKDVIIASGYKVWPREVEDVLYTHPAVREAAVVGVPDAYRGETVKAFVSLRAEASMETTEVIQYCRDRLASYKVPRIVEILPELPKTLSGKIQRDTLRRRST